jgi:hypothetical protein
MKQEFEGSKLCPCRSGKQYKNCCKKKAFKFVGDKDGKVYRRLSITGDLPKYLQETSGISSRKEMWAGTLGIDVTQMKDAQFVDIPYVPEAKFSPDGLDIIEIMKKANIPPELIYAFQRTGLIITEKNKRLISNVELKEFDEAVDEYLKKYKKGG